jgi:hypothetical protein
MRRIRRSEISGLDGDGAMTKEDRSVEVALVGASDEVNLTLTAELREAIGKDRVRVERGRPHVERSKPRRGPAWINDDRFLFRTVLPIAAVVGIVVALTSGALWVLPIAFAVLLGATYYFMSFVFRLLGERGQLSPTTVALLEEEGYRDPERLFSDLVDEFTEDAEPGE